LTNLDALWGIISGQVCNFLTYISSIDEDRNFSSHFGPTFHVQKKYWSQNSHCKDNRCFENLRNKFLKKFLYLIIQAC
jgi:hypothetical protein